MPGPLRDEKGRFLPKDAGPVPGTEGRFRLTLGFSWNWQPREIQFPVFKSKRRTLLKAGYEVRRAALSKLRKSKKTAAPGEPPKPKESRGGLKLIVYKWDDSTDTVVVGPVKFAASHHKPPTPAVHEFGGMAKIVTRRRGGMHSRTAKYPKRQFMRPSLETKIGTVHHLWKDSVRE